MSNKFLLSENQGKTQPKASVIIVNTNEKNHLEKCLPSISAQTCQNLEIIVVDNASSDNSVSFVKQNFPSVLILQNSKNLGYAGANNVGFSRATGEYVVVLNPDTFLHPNCIEELLRALEHNPQAGLATAKILLMDTPNKLNTCGNTISFTGLAFCRGLEESAESYPAEEVVAAVSGAAFAIRRSVIEHIGGFDDDFFIYYEETDLSLRAMLAGYKCIYVPSAQLSHQYLFKFSPKKNFLQERNRYYALLKTFRWRTLLILAPSFFIGEIISWGYSIMNGRSHVVNKFRSYLWLLQNFRQVLKKRQANQALRQVSDYEILRLFSHKINFTNTTSPILAKALATLFNPPLALLAKISLHLAKQY